MDSVYTKFYAFLTVTPRTPYVIFSFFFFFLLPGHIGWWLKVKVTKMPAGNSPPGVKVKGKDDGCCGIFFLKYVLYIFNIIFWVSVIKFKASLFSLDFQIT